LLPGTTTPVYFSNFRGCDSIVHLNVVDCSKYTFVKTFSTCSGEAIIYNGIEYLPGTITDIPMTTFRGCDSIVIIDLESYPDFDISVSATDLICWNDGDGEIVVNAISGGTTPFLYAFDESDFQIDSLISDTSASQYYVYVQDRNGCVEEAMIEIAAIPPLELNFIAPGLNCVDLGQYFASKRLETSDPEDNSRT
jgi:hypothetical protein